METIIRIVPCEVNPTLYPYTVEVQRGVNIIAKVICNTLEDAFKCIESEGMRIWCGWYDVAGNISDSNAELKPIKD